MQKLSNIFAHSKLIPILRAFARDEAGTTAIEYCAIVSVLTLVLVPAYNAAGWKVAQVLDQIAQSLAGPDVAYAGNAPSGSFGSSSGSASYSNRPLSTMPHDYPVK